MPAVTLRPSGNNGGARVAPRLRTLGVALGVTLGSAAPTLGLSGCDSTQYVLFTLQGLKTGGTVSLRTTYSLDSSPGKNGFARVTPALSQFAISFPPDTRGTLAAHVRAYTYVSASECYRSDGDGSIMLNGSHKQELVTKLSDATATGCDATQAPVTLPPTDAAPLATWGSDAKNIWIVGDKGMIQHWNGVVFSQITLPSDLAANPPTWRAVAGSSPGNPVWVAGDKGVVARWDGTNLTTVGLVANGGGTFTPGSAGPPSWVALAVENPATDEVFFVSGNGYIGYNAPGTPAVQTLNSPPTFPEYPDTGRFTSAPMSASVSFSDIYCIAVDECWFVGYDPKRFAAGDQSGGGTIFQVYKQNIYSDYSMSDLMPTNPLTRGRLRGVWGTPYAYPNGRQLYLVGDDGTVLFSNNTGFKNSTTLFPTFQTAYTAFATTALAGRPMQLNAIRGTSLTDLWIAGNGGVLMRWDATTALPGNPFTVVNTGVMANLTSVFSTGPDGMDGRVYVAGDQQTFFSP